MPSDRATANKQGRSMFASFNGRTVAKIFPGYGKTPFKGIRTPCDVCLVTRPHVLNGVVQTAGVSTGGTPAPYDSAMT